MRAVLPILLLAWPALAFEVNGKHWDTMPIPYYVNPTGAPDFGDGKTPQQVVAEATAVWSSVRCASVSFEYKGATDATYAKDGKNTIFWVTKDWPWGKEAAGATLWIPTLPGEPMEVDLALNAEQFKWVPGGGDALQSDVVDPVSVIAHELGHWLGLSHSQDQFATMYQALLPAGVQATLTGDDRAGICTLYPSGVPDCEGDEDCGPDHVCREVAGVTVCDEVHDPPGAPCDRWHLDCEGMCFISFYECSAICAFTATDYSEGYCAPLCGESKHCPPGFDCNVLASPPIAVCLKAQETPDAGEALDTPEGPGLEPWPGEEVTPGDEGPSYLPEFARAEPPFEVHDDGMAGIESGPEPRGASSGGCAAGGIAAPLWVWFVFVPGLFGRRKRAID